MSSLSHYLRRRIMYKKPEIKKHEELTQVTFSAH